LRHTWNFIPEEEGSKVVMPYGSPTVPRITLTLAIPEKEIVLLDIGSHDEVYR
jgi:hypothetical protein